MTLERALLQARDLGFLGPGPVEPHIHHALAFADGLPAPARVVDLGSGGGVPGLVLAVEAWPHASFVLLDAGQRRCAFLRDAIVELDLGDRVEVMEARAEEAGRDASLRAQADLVTARGFATPAVTAECAAPLLRVDGSLVVSEPPGGAPDRWDHAALATLGLVPVEVVRTTAVPALAHFRLATPCPDRYPRRVGIPAKRPLF